MKFFLFTHKDEIDKTEGPNPINSSTNGILPSQNRTQKFQLIENSKDSNSLSPITNKKPSLVSQIYFDLFQFLVFALCKFRLIMCFLLLLFLVYSKEKTKEMNLQMNDTDCYRRIKMNEKCNSNRYIHIEGKEIEKSREKIIYNVVNFQESKISY